jgi:hypothetical protein
LARSIPNNSRRYRRPIFNEYDVRQVIPPLEESDAKTFYAKPELRRSSANLLAATIFALDVLMLSFAGAAVLIVTVFVLRNL